MRVYIVVSISQDGFGKIKRIFKAFYTREKAFAFIETIKQDNIYEWYAIKEVEIES